MCLCCCAAIVKPKAGPSGGAYNEEDWNDEVDENAQGADAYRYSKVKQHVVMVCILLSVHAIHAGVLQHVDSIRTVKL